MHVGIDITPVIYSRGVSRYTANLLNALVSLKAPVQWTVFGSSLRQFSSLKDHRPAHTQAKFYRFPPQLMSLFFHRFHLPIEIFTGKLDVFHAWDWYLPDSRQAKLVTTIHDLYLFIEPGTAHSQIAAQHRAVIKRAIDAQAHFIAVSESTKEDLIRLFKVNPDQVAVIYEALPAESMITVDKRFCQEFLSKLGITKPFFLCVGTIEPRKNYPHILQAFSQFASDYQLVIAGQKGWQSLSPQKGVFLTGEVNSSELACLYQSASALVYASTYEGFGLPILEAFHHKLPVVTSHTSSMPEVAGSAAVLVDPSEPDSIASGMNRALTSSSRLIKLGTERLRSFSWKKAASETLEVYEKAHRS